MKNTELIISKIPNYSSVASQNNLLPHISHRKSIYLLPNIYDAEYIVVDLHPGQNDWNFYTYDLEKTKDLIIQIVSNNSYKIIASAGDAYLLHKSF